MEDDATMAVPSSQRQLQRILNGSSERAAREGIDNRDDDRMDEDGDGRDSSTNGSTTPVSSWYNLSYLTSTTLWSSNVNSSHDEVDCREEDISMERESGENHYYDDSRIHEPLKRFQGHEDDGRSGDCDPTINSGNKRQRLSMAVYQFVPSLTERQQVLNEYAGPTVLTPLFFVLRYSSFAMTWAILLFLGHTFQTMISDFGQDTKYWRIKPWISPMPHHLMDSYIWNQALMSYMLVYPDKFGTGAYWLACCMIMSGQLVYTVSSLKVHYLKHQATLTQSGCRALELTFVNCFLWYGTCALVFVLARILQTTALLNFGLVVFNLGPLVLFGTYHLCFTRGQKSDTKKTQ